MIVLAGTSLNKRHEELNTKVNEAAKSNVNFEEIKDKSETSHVDKLFKIDLASKYKNIDYILEVLKSGDSLYISRALKCDWIVDDEFAQFVNPKYFDRNIFPVMPLKMKKKVLATISTRLRNSERAEEFHHYCMRNRMYKLGMDFLIFTNESFKIEILTLHPHVYNDFNRNEQYVEHFIGNSFLLAEYYLKVVSNLSRSRVLHKLRYLYSVSEEKYLDLVETFQCDEKYYCRRISRRLSRSIMKKHKKRVLKDPWLYVHTLNRDVLIKYSNSDDAKVYAVPFLPDTCELFLDINYHERTEFFLNLIPISERYSFIKKIFSEKYPGEMFEENYKFYTFDYYKMMSEKEKEDWALSHIASKKELHGCGNDYIWYRFVNFERALVELKKFIVITTDKDKRSEIFQILVESAKTEEELTTLMDHYYNRHINESRDHKRVFLNTILKRNNILKVNNKCWVSFEKILFSLDVYHKLSQDFDDYLNSDYRALALIYYIIHKKPVPEVLQGFLLSGNVTVSRMRWSYNHYMDSTHFELVFHYMLTCLANHVEPLILTNTELKLDRDSEIPKFLNYILNIIDYFKKTFQDIPKLIRDYIMRKDVYELLKHHTVFACTAPPKFRISDIMHYLKKDSSLVITNFSTIKEYFEQTEKKKNINWLIQKLKIYFAHDISPEYIKLLCDCLSVEELYLHAARVAVYGIFNLSDEKYKIDFLKKYTPTDAKIDHMVISRSLLTIQTAICSVACQSRLPLPLSSIREYIKGDYLQYCIPIFDSYLANLTPAQCLCFVESLLDRPVSIQKYGLRLAFRCFSTENLKTLVLKVWKNTKNISLRKILYKSLFDKVNYYHDNLPAQWELFGVLNILTHDLHQEDDDEVFGFLSNGLPPNVSGQHLQSAYIVVSTFPKRTINYQRLIEILRAIENNLELISKNILLAIMEDHINNMVELDQILNTDSNSDQFDLIRAKWSLVETVIIKHINLHIVYLIMDKIKVKWYKTDDCNNYIYRQFYVEFVSRLEDLSYKEPAEKYSEINNIFETILREIENDLPHMEIYMIVWQLKLNILTRQVLGTDMPCINERYRKDDEDLVQDILKEIFVTFSHKVKNLMQEYAENKKFYPSFCQDIKYSVHNVTDGMKYVLEHFYEKQIRENNIYVILCSILSECDAREIHLFVMNFLPDDYDGKYLKEYLDVINKLKSLDDDEIMFFLCHHKLYT